MKRWILLVLFSPLAWAQGCAVQPGDTLERIARLFQVRVVNLRNKSVVVHINDRGPYVRGRIIDLSYASARLLGMHPQVVPVRLELLK